MRITEVRWIVLAVVIGWATAGSLHAQEALPPSAVPQASDAVASDQGPVAVPEPSEKAIRFYQTGNVLWGFETLWGFAVPALLLFSGFSARLRTFAMRLGRGPWRTLALYVLFLSGITAVINLPLDFYSTYLRPHAYGLSNQTLAKWWGDVAKGELVGLVFGVFAIALFYFCLRKSPRRWWLWLSLAAIPLVTIFLLVTPIWLDPLFNKFGPLSNPALETKILALADQAGIEGSDVYEVDKSVDTTTFNAYVAGFGATKRIVLWDTILGALDEREILVIMGHEMGHYVLHHIPYLIGTVFLILLVGLGAIQLSARGLIRRFGKRFGFTELSDVASLPLVTLLFALVTFVLSPALLAFNRSLEHEADRFGLEITRDNHAAATAFVKLQEQNLSNPRPSTLYKLWRSSHPPLDERIDFANSYRPWETGEPLKYGGLIREEK